jgi:hypothetical protein
MPSTLKLPINLHWIDLLRYPPFDGGSRAHLVQFYEEADFLADAITLFIGTGLRNGEAGVIIAKPEHRALVLDRLEREELEPARLQAEGQLLLLDAQQTLDGLLVDGQPQWGAFEQAIGGLVRPARQKFGFVRAYGEMVGLLRDQGQSPASLLLEGFWNKLGQTDVFSLLCAYHLQAFGRQADADDFAKICRTHSHVLPSESYLRLPAARDQFRNVAHLQQHHLAMQQRLQADTGLREELELTRRELNQALRERDSGVAKAAAKKAGQAP